MNKPVQLLRMPVLAGILSASIAQAAVDVEFVSPERFSDINNRGAFGQLRPAEVLDLLSKHLGRLGQNCIAPEQLLAIRITDVRLAGRLGWESGFWRAPDARIMRDVDWPSVELSWKRTGADGSPQGEGSETVSDMDYLRHAQHVNNDSASLPYERDMLTRWFQQRFCSAPTR